MFKKAIFLGGILVLVLAMAAISFSSTSMAIAELEELISEDLEIPTQIEDLIAKFSELDYQMTTLENGVTTYDSLNYYRYLGEENIQGESADKISLVIEPVGEEANEMIFWISDGNFMQAEIQGETIPGEMVSMMGDSLLQAVFAPFYNISEYDLEELARTGEVTTGQRMIGEKEVEIISITLEDVPQEELESGTVHLANLDNFLMVVGYEFVSGIEDFTAEFEILNFEIR